MGEKLAKKIKRVHPDYKDIDVIIPIPDTSRTTALQIAYDLNIPYREGFIKNRYIARTFIMPGQAMRKKSVRRKLNPIRAEFLNKNVLLVDDSIVRGTTATQIVQVSSFLFCFVFQRITKEKYIYKEKNRKRKYADFSVFPHFFYLLFFSSFFQNSWHVTRVLPKFFLLLLLLQYATLTSMALTCQSRLNLLLMSGHQKKLLVSLV